MVERMRIIGYAGHAVMTTDDVADALMTLAEAIARRHEYAAVTVPTFNGVSTHIGTARMLLGPGHSLVVEASPWNGAEPDFSTEATLLRMHASYPRDSLYDPPERDPFPGWSDDSSFIDDY